MNKLAHYDIVTNASSDVKVEFIIREHDLRDDYTVTIVNGRLRVTWCAHEGCQAEWEFRGSKAKKIRVGFPE